MTTLTISTRDNTPLSFGKFGSDALSFEPVKESWERRTDWYGGYIDGYFRITGDTATKLFESGLGYRVKETGDSGVRWEGFVYEMIYRGVVDREKSYSTMSNSVATRCRNLLDNGGFETGDFTSWDVTLVSGTATMETTTVANGTYSARLGSGVADDSWIQQTTVCTGQTKYRLTFYYDDTLGPAVRYYVFSDIGDIIPTIAIDSSNSRYRRFTVDFITQASASTLTVRLLPPALASNHSLFDDVRLEQVADERAATVILPFTENDESITTYGRKQAIVSTLYDEYGTAETARDSLLQAVAFPKTTRGGLSQVDEPTLDIFVRGYWDTLSWNMWTLETGGSSITVQTALAHIVDNNEFISAAIVNGSPPDVSIPETYNLTQADAIDAIIAAIGSGYRLFVGNDGILTVTENAFTPRYYMRGGMVYDTASSAIVGTGNVDDRAIQPAIVRDLDSALSGVEFGSSYADRRDFLMNRVEVTADGLSFGAQTG